MKVLTFFQGIPLEKGAFLYGIFMYKFLCEIPSNSKKQKGLSDMKNENTKNKNMKNLVNAALCLALCMVLPFLTGQIPQGGNMLLPMHLPVLLCGLICGWQYGGVVGFVLPLLRYALFSAPPMLKGHGQAVGHGL